MYLERGTEIKGIAMRESQKLAFEWEKSFYVDSKNKHEAPTRANPL